MTGTYVTNHRSSDSVLPQLTDDIFFSPDDARYIGYDSDNSVQGRPREIRFTRLLISDFAHAHGSTPAETNGFVMRNSTQATVGVQKWSPSWFLAGSGWKTDATAEPKEVVFRGEVQTVQGTAAPTGNYTISASVGGGAYAAVMAITSGGELQLNPGNATTAVIKGYQADGASAVGVALDTNAAYSNAGSKLFSIRNNGNEYVAVTFDGALKLDYAHARGTTYTEEKGSIVLRNSTAAAAGAQQASGSVWQAAQGWKTDATAASVECLYHSEVLPIQGAAAPTAELQWYGKIGGGADTRLMALNSGGRLEATGGFYTTASGFALQLDSGQVVLDTLGSTYYGVTAYTRGIRCENTGGAMHFVHSNRTDGANNVCMFSTYVKSTPATNADTMRVHAFGHSVAGGPGTFNEKFAVLLNGTVKLGTAHDADSQPTNVGAGQIVYFSNGDAGNPCLAVHNGTSYLRVVLGAAVASS